MKKQRHVELENVRLAAQVLEDECEDPDMEKKIMIQANTQTIAVSSDES
jgi:hypothetical protein